MAPFRRIQLKCLLLFVVWDLQLTTGGGVDVVVDAKAGADAPGCGARAGTGTAGAAAAAPCASLEFAVARLGVTGGTVTLANGVHHISTPTGAYVGARNLTIRGASSSRVIIDCSLGRCFNNTCSEQEGPVAAMCASTTLELTGIAIRNGNQDDSAGGAVLVVGANLSLRNVEFSNCSAVVGGAIYIETAASVALVDVSFTGCSASQQAAALSATAVPRLSISGTLFEGCAALEGAALVLSSCSGVIARSRFQNCAASQFGGGAASLDLLAVATSTSRLRFEGCSFANISSTGSGGAIESWAKTLEIVDTRAYNCSGKTGGFLHDVLRPAVADSSIAVRGCAFEACSSGRGGALYASNTALIVRDSAFAGCQAQSSGGAISSGVGNVALVRTNVTGCSAYVSGGAVEVSGGSLVVTSCVFHQNLAGTGGGCFSATLSEYGNSVVAHSFSAVVSGSEFSQCASKTLGGAMFVDSAIQGFRLNVSDSVFADCTALRGGAIYSAGEGQLSVANSRFSGCTAEYAGGGLSVVDTTALTLSAVSVSSCRGQRGGGLAFLRGSLQSSPSSLASCNFSQNTATGAGGGGAIYVGDDVAPVQVASTLFDGNVAQVDGGGAVALFGQRLAVSGSIFQRNNAKTNGGAISSSLNSSLRVRTSQFDANHGGLLGGGLYLTDSSRANVSLSNFSSNAASTGGAVCTDSSSQLALAGAVLSQNEAVDDGGALSVNRDAHALLDTCQLRNNSAGKGGGALHAFGSPTIRGRLTAFIQNRAQAGGVVYTLLAARLEFASCQFVGNAASGSGGVAFLQLESSMLATGCVFEGNAGAARGGCVYAGDGAAFTARGCNFLENAAETGGVGYMGGRAAASLTRCSLRGNVAGTGGGFAVDDSASLAMDEVQAEGNRAAATGGGVLAARGRSNVSLHDSYMGGNSALSAPGGAILVEAEAGFAIQVEGCQFVSNVAAQGGALALSQIDGGSSLVSNSVFSGNFARGNASSSSSSSSASFDPSTHDKSIAVEGSKSTSGSASESESGGEGGGEGGGDGGGDGGGESGIKISAAGEAGAGGGNTTTTTSATSSSSSGGSGSGGSDAQLVLRSYGEGGGIALVSPSNLRLQNLSFGSNVAKRGGGVYQAYLRAAPTFVECLACFDAGGNRAAHGSFLATAPTSVRLLLGGNGAGSSSSGGGGGSARGCGGGNSNSSMLAGGVLLLTSNERAPPLRAQLLDTYGNVAFVATGSTIASIEPDPHLTGVLAAVAAADGFEWTAVVAQTRPETDARAAVDAGLRFSTPVLVRSSAGEWPVPLAANLTVRFCPAGFYRRPSILAPATAAAPAVAAATAAGGTTGCANATAAAAEGEGRAGAAEEEGGLECVPCELGYYCEASRSHQACPDGTFSFAERASGAGECARCLGDNLACANGTLTIKPGCWANLAQLRSNSQAYQCSFAPAGCQGAAFHLSIPPNSTAQCAPGYRNERMCSKCAEGYYFLSGVNKCQKCSRLYKRLWVLLAVLVVAAWMALNVLCSLFGSMGILLTEMQFLTTLGGYNLNYFQGWINLFMRIFQVSLFDPDFLGPDCVMGSYTFTHRWVVSAGLPLVGIAMCVCYFLYLELVSLLLLRRRPSAAGPEPPPARHTRRQHVRQLVGLVGQALNIFYISVAMRCFQVFSSAEYDARVVSADVTISWESHTHHRLVPFAILYLVVYVAGFPLVTTGVLAYGRATDRLHHKGFIEMFGWMYERYEPQRWWYYVPFLSLRRVAFVSISVFLVSNPSLQAMLTLCVTLAAMLLQYHLHPCRSLSLNMLQEALLLGQVLFLLAGMGNSSTVHGAAASALGGAAVALYLLGSLLFVPYDAKCLWLSGWLRRWARLHSGPLEPPVRAWARLVPFHVHATHASVRQTAALREPGTAGSAPLETITDWFHPRVLHRFFMAATADDFRALQNVRQHYALHAPSEQEVERTSRAFSDFTTELQYAVVVQLLYGDSDDNNHASSGGCAVGASGHGGAADDGGGGGGGSSRSVTAGRRQDPEAAEVRRADRFGKSTRQLGRLQSVYVNMFREKSRGGDSIRLLLSRRMLLQIVAWLLYCGEDSLQAMRDLIAAVRIRLAFSSQLLDKDLEDDATEGPQGRVPFLLRMNLWFMRYFPR